jgi:thymidylate kinase
MKPSGLRTSLLKVLRGCFKAQETGVFFRSTNLEQAGDIDIFLASDKVSEFLLDFEMGLFGHHNMERYYDLTNKEVIKVDFFDVVTGEKDHIDLWYYRQFKTEIGCYYINNKHLVASGMSNGNDRLEPNLEALYYMLHLVDRKRLVEKKEISAFDSLLSQMPINDVYAICLEQFKATKNMDSDSLRLIVNQAINDGFLLKGTDSHRRSRWMRKAQKHKGLIAVLGGDGAGKTTVINLVMKRLSSQLPPFNSVWLKFRRVYHKSWLYRRVRNFIKRQQFNLDKETFYDSYIALYAAKVRMPLYKWFCMKGRINFIDRYFLDLGIKRKESPIAYYDSILQKSFHCTIPDGAVILRASPSRMFARKGELPVANAFDYYKIIFKWAFVSRVPYVVSMSTDNASPLNTSDHLADFISKKFSRKS